MEMLMTIDDLGTDCWPKLPRRSIPADDGINLRNYLELPGRGG